MFSALKKLTKGNDDRCPAPVPMSSSLQKKFSKGVHYNMKILIKGDRNVGKTCLLQRLQGGQFIEEYVPTEQIQVAPIHWTYKNSDQIVKVEVWEVVDKGRTKKKSPLGLKLENQSAPAKQDDSYDTPVLDATFLDVYKNSSGVILMLDITKPWTFEYVVKELSNVPADIPVVVLGNHCDMQHHRQVHSHHIDQAIYQAKLTRTAPVRYAESSMRNGFGLRLLHKFLSVPFLRLQRTSLLEQLQRNQRDTEEIENELNEYQNSEEAHYSTFVDRLANKRKQSVGQSDHLPNMDRSPSIVLGGGKPIIPPNVNPLLAQSLSPNRKTPLPATSDDNQTKQTHYVSQDLINPKSNTNVHVAPITQVSNVSSPSNNKSSKSATGALDEFYAGALDNSFLDDLTPGSNNNQDMQQYDSDSDENTGNPLVMNDEDDLEVDYDINKRTVEKSKPYKENTTVTANTTEKMRADIETLSVTERQDSPDNDMSDTNVDTVNFPLWAGDASVRRSPEGGEDPDLLEQKKNKKKHKKKKSKEKDKGDSSDKSEKKKHKHKKSSKDKEAPHPQLKLLETGSVSSHYNYSDYVVYNSDWSGDSI